MEIIKNTFPLDLMSAPSGFGLPLKKIEEITSFQIACLEIWAKKFWFAKWKKGDKSLKEYVKLLK